MTEQNINNNEDIKWLNPIGSLGDAIILSGILYKLHVISPLTKYNIVRRSYYQKVFENHPAINEIGYPDKNAQIDEIDFWFDGELEHNNVYEVLAKRFGLPDGIDEKLYIPNRESNSLLLKTIPWREKNIIISTSSSAPRKMLHLMRWAQLVEMLRNENFFILQVGTERDLHIKGAYSLLGLTNFTDIVEIVNKADAVITLDNLIKVVSQLTETPAVVLWGPTRAAKYGFKSQVNIEGEIDKCKFKNTCLGAKFEENYHKACPLPKNEHCANLFNIQEVFNSIINLIN